MANRCYLQVTDQSVLLSQSVSYYTFFTFYMCKKNTLHHYLAFIPREGIKPGTDETEPEVTVAQYRRGTRYTMENQSVHVDHGTHTILSTSFVPRLFHRKTGRSPGTRLIMHRQISGHLSSIHVHIVQQLLPVPFCSGFIPSPR